MALVYEARRESLAGVSPRVAIKLILPEHAASQTYKDLFVNEARLGASMHHQNLVQIQDFDCEGDTWFLVMEYVEGFTLRRLIGLCAQHGLRMPMAVIAELGRQACDGLHYAHQATDASGRSLELVHRDIKPSNLILSPHGTVKVLDFGISKGRLREERSGSVKGTWGYMAPEQAMGEEVGPPADVFGLATVLYELASLEPMFRNRKKEDIRRLLRDDHAARVAATLDGEAYGPLLSVLVHALQRDPAARFPTAEAFGRALSALLSDPITARDEVVRFYQELHELADRPPTKEAAPAPAPAPEGDGDDEPVSSDEPGLVATFAVGALLSAGLLVGVALTAVTLLTEPVQPPPVEPAPVAAAPAPAAPEPEVEVPDPEPEPVTVKIVRRAEPEPEPAPDDDDDAVAEPPPPDEARAVPPPPEGDEGTLVVDARQPAEVYIGGQYVAQAPVRQHLPPGRYAVALIANDGRRRTFQVQVEAGEVVDRTWDFDRMEWR
jgi:serine/threonine-protein kinase